MNELLMINWTFKQQSGEWGCRMKKKYTRKGQRHSIPEYPHNLIVFKSLSWNPFFNLAKSLICPCTTMHGCYNFIRALFHLYLNYFLKNAKLSERERENEEDLWPRPFNCILAPVLQLLSIVYFSVLQLLAPVAITRSRDKNARCGFT